MKSLRGKSVLITGASSGIGRGIAIRFSEEGAHVAINYRGPAERADAEETLVDAIRVSSGGHHTLAEADVTDEPQVREMVSQVVRGPAGRLDVLINNAGIQRHAPSHELALDEFEKVLAVNLRGPFLCSREAIRHFLSRPGGGVILNNTSVHETIPKPQYLSYSASKGGLSTLTRSLALEYAAAGIRVNAVGPGAVATPINRAWVDDPDARATVESHIPMGRAADPAEIAGVFAFLASDDASYITGQTLFACGGLTLYPEFRTNWSS